MRPGGGDPDSGIASYSYAIGTTPDSEDVVPWTSVEAALPSPERGSRSPGQTYYFRVRPPRVRVVSDAGVSDALQVATRADDRRGQELP